MRSTKKIFVALAAAGIVAASGSAFTATSTLDDYAINVGSVEQTVSGADVFNVVHTYTAADDITTQIAAKSNQWLSTSAGVVKVSINGGGLETCTVGAAVDANSDTLDSGSQDYSPITCDIADDDNVTSVRFVVNG